MDATTETTVLTTKSGNSVVMTVAAGAVGFLVRRPGRPDETVSAQTSFGDDARFRHHPLTPNAATAAKRFGLDPKTSRIFGTMIVTADDLPALDAAIAASVDHDRAAKAAAAANLSAALPGLDELRDAEARLFEADARRDRAFSRMMEDESNDGIRPPADAPDAVRDRVKELRGAYPHAALYLKAERQLASGHWSDASGGKAAAGRCQSILLSGGTVEAAAEALAFRPKTDQWV